MTKKISFHFNRVKSQSAWVIFTLAVMAFTPIITLGNSDEPAMSIGTYFYTEYGFFNEVQNYEGEAINDEHFIVFMAGVNFLSQINENFKILFKPEFLAYTPIPTYPGTAIEPDFDVPSKTNKAYVEESKGIWTYGDEERPSLQITLGYQYHKDNPHTKTFGDYLYRSMIYPSLIVTGFQKARARLLGLKVMKTHGDMFSHYVLVESEMDRYPYGDISIGYSAIFNVGNMFEIGAGINWKSAIPIRPSRTSPVGKELWVMQDNTYKEVPFQEMTLVSDTSGPLKYITLRPIAGSDSTAILMLHDPAGVLSDSTEVPTINGKVAGLTEGMQIDNGGMRNPDALNELTTDESNNYLLYPELGGTEIQFTYAGQIVNFRAAFNPLANNPDLLGKDALKIYMEAAVLGWKDYPFFYDNRSERTVVMGGLYLPTLNFLDELAVEIEHYPSKWPATWQFSQTYNVPQPGGSSRKPLLDRAYTDPDRQKRDDWKWSLYARKNFNKGFGIWGQGGTDHLRGKSARDNYQELMSNPSQWYIMGRLVFNHSLLN